MLARPDAQHDVLVGKYRTNRVHAPGERFAQEDDVRADVVVVACQHLAGSAKALQSALVRSTTMYAGNSQSGSHRRSRARCASCTERVPVGGSRHREPRYCDRPDLEHYICGIHK